MKLLEKLAKEYVASPDCWVDDTYAAHEDSFVAGFNASVKLAIDRVKYSRFSIVLSDDNYTRGYIQACKDIQERIEKVVEEV